MDSALPSGLNLQTLQYQSQAVLVNGIPANSPMYNDPTNTLDNVALQNVMQDGGITAISLSSVSANVIRGGLITAVSIKVGSNFVVDSSGNLTANNGNFTGVVNVTGGYVSGNLEVTGQLQFPVNFNGDVAHSSLVFFGDQQTSYSNSAIFMFTTLGGMIFQCGYANTFSIPGLFSFSGTSVSGSVINFAKLSQGQFLVYGAASGGGTSSIFEVSDPHTGGSLYFNNAYTNSTLFQITSAGQVQAFNNWTMQGHLIYFYTNPSDTNHYIGYDGGKNGLVIAGFNGVYLGATYAGKYGLGVDGNALPWGIAPLYVTSGNQANTYADIGGCVNSVNSANIWSAAPWPAYLQNTPSSISYSVDLSYQVGNSTTVQVKSNRGIRIGCNASATTGNTEFGVYATSVGN